MEDPQEEEACYKETPSEHKMAIALKHSLQMWYLIRSAFQLRKWKGSRGPTPPWGSIGKLMVVEEGTDIFSRGVAIGKMLILLQTAPFIHVPLNNSRMAPPSRLNIRQIVSACTGLLLLDYWCSLKKEGLGGLLNFIWGSSHSSHHLYEILP